MSIWNVSPIEEQPSVTLYNWIIKKTNKGEYFVGSEVGAAGRVSTQIKEFDPNKMLGRTASGRVYKLQGEEGYSPNGEYVWDTYKVVNGLVEL